MYSLEKTLVESGTEMQDRNAGQNFFTIRKIALNLALVLTKVLHQ
jgi:hypothetical protein